MLFFPFCQAAFYQNSSTQREKSCKPVGQPHFLDSTWTKNSLNSKDRLTFGERIIEAENASRVYRINGNRLGLDQSGWYSFISTFNMQLNAKVDMQTHLRAYIKSIGMHFANGVKIVYSVEDNAPLLVEGNEKTPLKSGVHYQNVLEASDEEPESVSSILWDGQTLQLESKDYKLSVSKLKVQNVTKFILGIELPSEIDEPFEGVLKPLFYPEYLPDKLIHDGEWIGFIDQPFESPNSRTFIQAQNALNGEKGPFSTESAMVLMLPLDEDNGSHWERLPTARRATLRELPSSDS